MSGIRTFLVVAAAVVLLGACESMRTAGDMIKKIPFEAGPAEQKLASGIKSYENGDYKGSQVTLQAALDAGLSSKADQVAAHKYLAFMDCVSGREKQCREEFRKALEIDPSFDLKPAEAGHPLWGPVFRNVKEKPVK